MAERKIEGTAVTDLGSHDYAGTAAAGTDFQYTPDDAADEELKHTPDWSKWRGYYNDIPELQAVIDKKAIWTVGRGFRAGMPTRKILSRIRGCGKDTINTIWQNNIRAYTICGDSFSEQVRDKAGRLRNLKPFNPGSITIQANSRGVINKYVQKNNNQVIDKWDPEEIFHLPWMRLADAIHGIGTIEKLTEIVEARKEATRDLRVVFHRYVKPLIIVHADTDDDTEIAAFATKFENSVKKAENMIIPKGVAEKIERIAIPQYSTLDPLPWLKLLQEYFLISEGVPEVILGYGRETTEASSKILYLAFQQMIRYNQDFLEEQIKAQLGLKIDFVMPARIDENLASDENKDSKIQGERRSELQP